MYKKIELLSKENHKDLKIEKIENLDFLKNIPFATLGLSEVPKVASRLPVLISGGDKQEFAVIMSIGKLENYYINWKAGTATYIPATIKAYPFLMVDAKEEGSDKKFRAIALDVDSKFVGDDKKEAIFQKDRTPSKYAASKMQIVQNLDKDKANALKLISALKQFNLLDKRNFDIKINDKETKTILSDFYVVNRERFYKLEDAVLADFTRKGWTNVIESHIDSISNIEVLLSKTLEKK